ncbi:TolC family outer membrane protein [Thiohalobacter sp. IOR34]|uniref:TolC family outer membrane protein n=1 Tax=Thiohalobacter sp. IOR34 TaxID=3057176 RepID=UPI0025B06505|nr:TolC family outer membrane protein [Thiohalobacter sp. IOR34]WJW75260.1 TolC family outer membrane protein [Thiohalobacter sp. IOR34]
MPTRKQIQRLALAIGLALGSAGAPGADLLQVYRQAREQDPGLRAAAAARQAALEARPQARALLLPSLGFQGKASRNSYDKRNSDEKTAYSTNQTYTLALTQPLYRYDRIVQLRQADSQIAQAEAEYSAAEQELMLKVAERYFDVLAAVDDLRFARADKDAIHRQLEQAQQRFEVGLIAITDVQEAQARFDLATSQVILAENRLDSAREALREITGALDETLQPLGEGLELVAPQPQAMDAWVERALEGNLGLAATRAAVEAARKEVRRQYAGHYPTLDLTASYTYQDANFGGVFPLERNDGSIGVELNIPIYQGGLVSSRTRQANHLLQQARDQLEAQRRSTTRQTRDAYRGVVSGIAQVRAMEQALKSTETALRAAETGFEVGTRTIVDVLNAQQERYRAERDLARARYDYLLNTLRLKQAAGSLSPQDIEQVNRWLQ